MDPVLDFLGSDAGAAVLTALGSFLAGWLLPNRLPASVVTSVVEALGSVARAVAAARRTPPPPAVLDAPVDPAEIADRDRPDEG